MGLLCLLQRVVTSFGVTQILKTNSETFQNRLIWVLFKLGLSCEPRKIGPHIYWAFKDNIWRRWPRRVSVSRPAAVSNACSRDIPIHRKLEEKWQIGSRVRGKWGRTLSRGPICLICGLTCHQICMLTCHHHLLPETASRVGAVTGGGQQLLHREILPKSGLQ